MNLINPLDKNTIDQIAAGEVVERPSSVVKELMENAIDAGATSVSVEIRDGGISLIRITDNGSGIDKSQIHNAFLRHSTSKIKNAQDISFLSTLGFRGEALSSIAAVSKTELCSKTRDSLTGSIYLIHGGEEISQKDAGLPDGTTILIRDLFYNTPARLKFLKSPQTEAGYASAVVEKIALSHPEIAFKFTNNGAVRLSTSGNGSLKDVIYAVYGRDIAANMLEIHAENSLLRITGYIGKPELQRNTRNYENFFINGRYVKDRILSGAVEEAYKGYQMKGAFPFTVLNIELEPELMDVNVHPSKMEIRFFDNEQVFESVYQMVRGVLHGRENIPAFQINEKPKANGIPRALPEAIPAVVPDAIPAGSGPAQKPEPVSTELPEPAAGEPVSPGSPEPAAEEPEPAPKAPARPAAPEPFETLFKEKQPVPAAPLPTGEQMSLFGDRFLSSQARAKHRIAGVVFQTYWIVEYENSMYLIDQHAAHEKVLYERFMKRLKEQQHYGQMLSPALIVTLNATEEAALQKYLPQFESLGFEVEHYGGCEYALLSVPADLYSLNDKELFLSFLDDLSGDGKSFSSDMLMDRVATAACKAAVKGGNSLSRMEAEELIDELLQLENPYNCPHGRPTIITMTKNELEKKFKRIL